MADDIQFIDGLLVKPPHANAPDYVKAKLSIKREDLIAWLQSQSGEWINAEVKVAKSGRYYAAVDAWKPDRDQPRSGGQSAGRAPAKATDGPKDDFVDDDIPF